MSKKREELFSSLSSSSSSCRSFCRPNKLSSIQQLKDCLLLLLLFFFLNQFSSKGFEKKGTISWVSYSTSNWNSAQFRRETSKIQWTDKQKRKWWCNYRATGYKPPSGCKWHLNFFFSVFKQDNENIKLQTFYPTHKLTFWLPTYSL